MALNKLENVDNPLKKRIYQNIKIIPTTDVPPRGNEARTGKHREIYTKLSNCDY